LFSPGENDILGKAEEKMEEIEEGKKMTILIADDEARIRTLIAKYAAFEGYLTEEAEDGMQAVEMCRKKAYDLVIMDVMMPELDGFSAVREIRKERNVPVIMLSARGEEYDRIHGFEIGVDDYVVKPFSPRELMMRVSAVLKRSGGLTEAAEDIVKIGELEVNFTARRVSVEGRELDLSPKEYDLLFYMVRNRGIALTREKLISDVWGYDFFGDDRTLDTHIKLLRRELGPCADKITTLRGVGYRFEKD
jgi:DNA-binding response OmpR family regulator